ncbi:hypothetical protein GYH30_034899 [Glycine max]|nr:hypothetical protein GYH30_034899 [Glycine max]
MYMDQLYFDGMTICSSVGFLDLFLNFTCNPYWPKIQRSVSALNLTIQDRPNIVTRIFKLKLEQLIGLSHAHILIFLHPANKYPSPTDIDTVILAEIPDAIEQPKLYECVKYHMMHGPCGHANRKSPCIKYGKYGFPIYRRRNDGKFIEKNHIALDNRYVVPCNPNLLLKYDDNIDALLSKPIVKESMFTWLQANSIFNEGKHLTYVQFITKFTYVAKDRCWKPRKGGYTIERLNWVPPSTGELYYLRMMFAMEYIGALREAYHSSSCQFLRRLFVTMLISNSIKRPDHVWSETLEYLIDSILHDQRMITNIPDLELAIEELQNLVLLHIEEILQSNKKSLKNYPSMPFPRHVVRSHFDYIYIYTLNKIMTSYGGIGKTFMWKTLVSIFRSKGDIVLTISSSGIASLLPPNGRTTYSKFVIHVPTLDNSTCNIYQGTELATLLKATKLIIWDEAPMTHNVPFGGKVVVFGGDFWKILSVIPKGSRSDIVHATINASYMWDYCTFLKLTKNMCLYHNSKMSNIEIPPEFLITNFTYPIEFIVTYSYPNIRHNYNNEDFLKSKAILASNIEIVDQINKYVLNIMPGDEKEYLRCDSIDMTDVFLHSLKTFGLLNHKIRLKTGTPIMLIQNLDQAEGLCNGTGLIVSRMSNHSLEFVGLYLPKSVFINGQLYVAFSRIQSKSGLKIMIHDKEGKPQNITTNVIFKEMFQNL